MLETVLAAEPLFRVKPWFLSRSLLAARRRGGADTLAAGRAGELRRPLRVTALERYAQRLFAHPAFRASLSEAETGHAPVKLRRPYLLRAMHEWISDSQCTPHVVVDAGVKASRWSRASYVQDGKIVLNVSWTATFATAARNDELSFSGRFGGASMHVRVPLAAVLAIYARETGQGMVFAEETDQPPPDAPPPEPAAKEPESKPRPGARS